MIGDIKNRVPRPVKISLQDDMEPSPTVLDYCLNQWNKNKQRFSLLENYFHNNTAIQNRASADPDKPNNKISHAFAKYITKIATAYFMGYGIRYEVKNDKYLKELTSILDGNMTKIKHFEEAKEMSKQGISFELLFINPQSKLKTQFYAADEMIPIYSQTPGNFLTMVLRPYSVKSIEKESITEDFVDVYTKQFIYIFRRKQGGQPGQWEQLEQFSHNFSDVPVIVRYNNAECKSDYEDVIPQIDGYDKAQSDTSNDLDYFTDAYMALEGASDIIAEDDQGEELNREESVKVMKRERMLFFPEGGKGYFITKDTNDVAPENQKNRLFKDIFFLAQVPNLTDEDFAGNLSGVAIKYKIFGLEELCIEKETYFTSSELKKIRFVTEYINMCKNTNYDWRTVTLKFDRSAVANDYEIAQIMNMLRDILSDETLIGMYPNIKNAANELEKRVQEQQNSENTSLPDQGKVF